MPVFEITGEKGGISRSGVTFLQPANTYQELEDGFIFRQVLQSRLGMRQFARGGTGSYNLVASKGIKPAETDITTDNVGNTANLALQTFTLSNVPIRKTYLNINVPLQSKSVFATYNGTTWDFIDQAGVAASGTINETTGAVTATFDAVLTAGDPIECDYQQLADVSVTAAAAAQQSFTADDKPIVRGTVVVDATTDVKTVTITAATSDEILAEGVGNSANSAAQTFYVDYIPMSQSDFTLSLTDSVLGAKSIIGTYTDGAWVFTGDVNTGGTNTVDEAKGDITVTFDAILTGGDAMSIDYFNNDGAKYTGNVDLSLNNSINWNTGAIQVGFDAALTAATLYLTYDFYPSLRIMGIFEHIEPDESKKLLVFDKNYLYEFSQSNNAFIQIPFQSSNQITTFGISSNEDYVSGVTYPKKDFTERFVFTGKGMSDVYFYDGYGVKRFTNAIDSPDYVAFGSTAQTLTRAKHVAYWNERLNLIVPTLDGTTYTQGWLFSGIRNSAGNGDSFNVTSSGLNQLDTQDFISGIAKINDVYIFVLYQSVWAVEKTRDNFKPFRVREISTAQGSEVDFATIGWDKIVETFGKYGIIGCDARETLRRDDALPFFTRDEVDPNTIDLTYAGYDLDNSQFVFAYRSTEAVDETTQNKVLTHNYEEQNFAIFNQRFSVFGETQVGKDLTWNQIDENIDPSWGRWDTTEQIWNKIGLALDEKKLLGGDDNGFIWQLNLDYEDQRARIFGISKASSAVLDIEEHSFAVGDKVRIENVSGMTEINSETENADPNKNTQYYTVTAIDVGQITIDAISTDYTTYGYGGFVSKVIEFKAKLNEFNPWRDQGLQCYLKEVEFLLDTDGGTLRIDVFDNSSPNAYIENVLIQPTSTTKNSEFVKLSIENVADFHTIQMRQLSTEDQVRIKSIRILAEPAGQTND